MLIAPGSPIPQCTYTGHRSARQRRGRQVLDVGLTFPRADCPAPTNDLSVPLPVAAQIAAANQPGNVTLQSRIAIGPATVAQAAQGATFSVSDFQDAPTVVPMNITPEMAIQRNPQALMERRKQRKQASGNSSAQSAGVGWGEMPSVRPGTSCGPSGSFAGTLRANPLGALLIVSGLGVIVYAVATGKRR